MCDWQTTCWQRGYDDCIRGLHSGENPFNDGADRASWNNGWFSADADCAVEQIAGQELVNTGDYD